MTENPTMKKLLLFFSILVLLLFSLSCSGGSSSGGGSSSTHSVISYSSYSDLYTYNASSLDGRTIRWETPIRVYTNLAIDAQRLVSRWGLSFVFDNSPITTPPANAISMFPSNTLSTNTVALTRTSYYTSGKIYMAVIYLNTYYLPLPPLAEYYDTVTHEAGHAIGFFGHTSDGGLMDATTAGSSEITSTVRNVISLLYSLPIGTNVSAKLGFKTRPGGRYQPNGTEIITKDMYLMSEPSRHQTNGLLSAISKSRQQNR
jgi:hypothetical protein